MDFLCYLTCNNDLSEWGLVMTHLSDYIYLGFAECAGCGRSNVKLSYFPYDYPEDKMMCCACTQSYYWHLGIPNPPQTNGYHCTELFCEAWWSRFEERIEKAMRLQ